VTTLALIELPGELRCSTCGHQLAQDGAYEQGDTTGLFECRNSACPEYEVDLLITYRTYDGVVQP
jgi:hypothetical protein